MKRNLSWHHITNKTEISEIKIKYLIKIDGRILLYTGYLIAFIEA